MNHPVLTALLAIAWPFSAVLAQSPGNDGVSFLSIITQVGLSGVFLWLFFDATKERRKAQADLAALFERLLPIVDRATAALESVQTSMTAQVTRATENFTKEDMKKALERLEDVTEDMERHVRRARGVEE